MTFEQFIDHLKAAGRTWAVNGWGAIRVQPPSDIRRPACYTTHECPITCVYHHLNPDEPTMFSSEWPMAAARLKLPANTALRIAGAADGDPKYPKTRRALLAALNQKGT